MEENEVCKKPRRVSDIKEYVAKILKNSEVGIYIKGAPITAYQTNKVVEGQTVLADGTVEREYWRAEIGDWIAVGPGGERWPITAETFRRLYDIPENSNAKEPVVYQPKPIARFCIEVKEDILFPDPWEKGKWFVLKAGGFLNISTPGKIYGIGRDEFFQTHVEANQKIKIDNEYAKAKLKESLLNATELKK